jgi:hypothetical protein
MAVQGHAWSDIQGLAAGNVLNRVSNKEGIEAGRKDVQMTDGKSRTIPERY